MKLDISKPVLYLITRGEATDQNLHTCGPEICGTIRRAAEAGITIVQLREKNLSGRFLYELACEASAATRGTATRLLISDRADIAVASRADGVHLTSQSIPVRAVRRVVPNDFLIGVSTHSETEIDASRDGGADFAVYGPVFATPGKAKPEGLHRLAHMCHRFAGFPILALGGVSEENFESVILAGAAGAAAIRWLNEPARTPDPAPVRK